LAASAGPVECCGADRCAHGFPHRRVRKPGRFSRRRKIKDQDWPVLIALIFGGIAMGAGKLSDGGECVTKDVITLDKPGKITNASYCGKRIKNSANQKKSG